MNTNLAKFFTSNFHSKKKHFFSGTYFSFNFHFFFRTPEILHLHFSSLSTLWKFFFGHLDFFSSHKTLRFFLRHYTDTWHFSFTSRKNLANVHPRTIKKFLSNIERNWHRNFLTNRNYSKQYNRIHRYKTHTHKHIFFFWSKEIWAANSEFNRVSRENSA